MKANNPLSQSKTLLKKETKDISVYGIEAKKHQERVY
jgi:hypothetical protein